MPAPRTWDVDDLRLAVAASTSMKQTLEALGLRAAGGNFKSIKGWIERLELSTDHWCKDVHPPPRRVPVPLDEVLVEHSRYDRSSLKLRLYGEGLKQRVCEMCGQGEEWQGRRMSLTLDHINGVHDDNRLENLRIVCPNCAATLDTHCGRNNARGAEPLTCPICSASFRPRDRRQRYCSRACGQRAPGNRTPRPTRRKVERPPLEVLLAETKAHGFSATGRTYGVSDNAVRKWILAAERERARAEAADAVAPREPAA